MPPNRCSNYPGRPRAIFLAACSATGGGARHRAREASAVLGGTCSECRSRSAETREPWQAQSSNRGSGPTLHIW